jgi:ribosomal-protein-alanine N-acetyltransferase
VTGAFIEGPRLLLREVRLADVTDRYYGWMNDPEVSRYLETRFVPQSMEKIAAYVTAMGQTSDSVFLAIVVKDGARHIGNIKLGPIDWVHRRADIALVIGDKISDYAFGTLGLHKVTAGCYANNVGSAKAFAKAGFAREGVRLQQYFCDGGYVDEILLGRVRRA